MNVAGLLLTGGASTRMGRDKATIDVGGETLAGRVARVLRAVSHPVFAVGPEAGTALESIDDPRQGPLVAIAAARKALLQRTHDAPALILACDLPHITTDALNHLKSAASTAGADIVVPTLENEDQSLCAWYSRRALDEAVRLAAEGERSLKALLASGLNVHRIPATPPDAFRDADLPEDLLQ